VFVEPMIYLRDLAVECARARDGRTLRISVLDNDLVTSDTDPQVRDEHPPVEGARVKLEHDGDMIGESTTGFDGRVAFATPGNVCDDQLIVRVEHPEFNSRSLSATGRLLTLDPRQRLYG